MKKATYNSNGEYTGFYDDKIHENIPNPYIELTEEQWQQALSKNYRVVDGVHTYYPYVEDTQSILENIRIKRNELLADSDWTQLNDITSTEGKNNEWKIYRQELRDLTNSNDLTNISWPIKPE